MASGGYDREVDTRVTCSICLEPYGGRFPKLLPCFHTFCLPCLTQLALASPTNRKPGIGDGATSGGSIACPTCRSLIPLPAGGVAAFQGNFYLFERDNETEPQPMRAGATCDICDSAQLAKYCCQKCQQKYCNRCQRCHDKFCSTGVPLAQRSNQQHQRAENSAASEEWQRKLNDLAQNFVVLQTANTLLTQNVTSLHDTQKKLSTEMTTQNDNHKKEIQSMQKDMSALRNENSTLSHDIMSLQKENNKLQQNMSAVQAESSKNASGVQSLTSQTESQKQEIQSEKKEISSLKDEGAKLRQDVSSLQKENSKQNQDLAAFQSELSQRHRTPALDGSQAQKDLLQLWGDNKRLVADVKSLQTGQSRIGDQCEQVLTNYKQMEANLKGLQAKVSSLEKDVSKPAREETSSSDAAVPHAATSDVQDQIWDLPSTKKGNTKVKREKKSKKKRPQTFQNSESKKKEGREESSRWLVVSSSSEGLSDQGEDENCPICLEPVRHPKKLPCGHTFCTVCVEHALSISPRCPKCQRTFGLSEFVEDENCPICLEPVRYPKKLPCGDTFCTVCIEHPMSISPRCPKCRRFFGIMKGTQPRGGKMTNSVSRVLALPGYDGCGTIVIQYYIPSGIQEACHPCPGRMYASIQRTAYLPDNKEGREVLKMLRKAFDQRLVFTIGDSTTTGARGVLTWDDIHHKTATHGGRLKFGYPDPSYLKQVKEQLAAKGITSPDP